MFPRSIGTCSPSRLTSHLPSFLVHFCKFGHLRGDNGQRQYARSPTQFRLRARGGRDKKEARRRRVYCSGKATLCDFKREQGQAAS
ncbi:hypothetical protein GOP47_0019098 [Adiantum capillus-veneris]|uniref:Uncharacterized protein n=1 Tax=Adiantum capillus-veneris TaxID=13818 RepID=A0A9D4Z9C7_ADICA|nr:hypothetical protein GOP47_0019098 [Adiantum capillus-veneris]